MKKTKNIDTELKTARMKGEYNKTKNLFIDKFSAYVQNILEDNLHSPSFVKGILKTVCECETMYKNLFSLRDRFIIYFLKRQLKKEHDKINLNKVTNALAILAGRLAKTEDTHYE